MNLNQIASSKAVNAQFTSQLNKINDYADNKYQELKEIEERLMKKSRAPNFTNRKRGMRGKIASRLLENQKNLLKTSADRINLFSMNKKN